MSDVRNGRAWKETPWRAPEAAYDDRADDVRAPQWEEAAAAGAAALVPHDAPLAPGDVAGNLRRYARWQWRDFWQRRGFWMAGAALFGVWLLTWIQSVGGPNDGPMTAENTYFLAHLMFAGGGAAAGLLGTGGLVARERERGLQRFLFAKPLNILRYYLQGLSINGVGSLLVVLGAVVLAALALPHAIPVLSVFGVAAAAYALTSGLTFFVSTLVRYDAPIAFAWLAAGFPVTVAAQATLAGRLGMWWAVALQWLFPQGWAVEAVKAGFRPVPNEPTTMIFVTAAVLAVVYGALCVAAGVAVLRRRSIQT